VRYSELIENLDDDELFGNPRHVIIAQGLYAEAAKEREIADEERGIGDLQNSHDFAVQAAETEALAREFAASLHTGMAAWRNIKDRWRRNDFANIVEDHTGIDLHEINKVLGEELDDDELFGSDNDTRKTLRTLKRLRQSVEQDPQAHGIRDLLKNYNNENSTLEQRAAMVLEYMASTIGMTKEQFEAAAPDLMFAANFEYHRPWQLWDLKTIDKTIKFFKYAADNEGMNEDADDDDMFAAGTRERIIQHIGNYIDEMEADLSQTMHPDEREWLVDEITSVSELFELAKRDISAAMDQLVSDSESHGWAGSLLASLEEAGINIGNVYTAPWLSEDADDDELFGETTLLKRIEQLLSAKQKVFTRVPGAMGQVMSLNGDNLILKTRPHSTTRYSWGGLENNPDRFRLERNPADGRWYLVDAENPFNYRG
jgi:hypothetical protein